MPYVIHFKILFLYLFSTYISIKKVEDCKLLQSNMSIYFAQNGFQLICLCIFRLELQHVIKNKEHTLSRLNDYSFVYDVISMPSLLRCPNKNFVATSILKELQV